MWDPNNLGNVFLFGLYANLIAGAIAYFHGIFLRMYYLAKFKLAKEQKDDADDYTAQMWLYIFYAFTFLWFWGGNVIFIWQM